MDTEPKRKGYIMGMRYIQATLLFIALVAMYFSRVNIGVAVVAMTNAETTNPNFPEFDWSEKQISYILSSFYWGFCVTQLPGGVLCKKYGSKLIMGLAIFCSGVLSVLTPFSVNWGGWKSLCVIRIVLGLAQGLIMPCVFDHLAKWSPEQERNRLGAFSHTGYDCGMVLAMALSGVIAESSMGWPGISYVSAGLCFVWCLLWLIFAANNPGDSKYISEVEKLYIESSNNQEVERKMQIPWRAIFTSIPFIALLVVRSAEQWGLTTLETQIPSYLNGVLKMEIRSNAFFSALPFLASWLISYIFMILADILQNRQILSLTAIRKVINSVAYWIPALGFIAMGFLDENQKTWALSIMIFSTAINGGEIIGSSLNAIDLSPNHAGLLYSIINTVASVVALMSPLAAGFIVTDVHSRYQWQMVFVIAAVVFIVGNLVYIIFGTAKVQSWNSIEEDKTYPEPEDIESESDSCKHKTSFLNRNVGNPLSY
ncbi:putative inorganic phosphate cotransporter isoform X1 [Stomoxys calcitrans]|uniref:putative inorganic phosphate cotransporter isoform X1 n=2 Tax=Stomoxys calcitrans TaxID=35570 RepID=UPI0027E23266|nr:putative inorganic phosphate cotransporter isoform X1 [Stomoxys calcitrans]